MNKKEAEYKPSSDPTAHRCGICEFYKPVPGAPCPTVLGEGACILVEGSIEAMYGCKLYSVDLVSAVNDPLVR